jgi:copper chaperone CopZ
MKKQLLTTFVLAALALTGRAETTAKLTGVHLCCNSCVKGAEKAIGTVPGASVACDKDAGTVTVTAPDEVTAQKAADALVAAGYFGQSENPAIKIADKSGAKDGKVSTLEVDGVHLCCPKCVKAVNAAVGGVAGVSGNDATKNAEKFEVKGDFNGKEVFAALQKAGLTGTAGK